MSQSGPDNFDINKFIRLVPSFIDRDVDKYFTLFVKINKRSLARNSVNLNNLTERGYCHSKNVQDFGKLRDFILLEEFRNCLPDKIATSITEQKVSTVSEAAVLADEFVLTHKDMF